MGNDNFNMQEFIERSRVFRKKILTMLEKAGSGHSGGSLSCIDILNMLYFYKMKHDPSDPGMEDRDIFIMSKGHASPAVYVTLAGAGYFPEDELDHFRQLGHMLQGHVHIKVPGVELSTGSLGQGLSVANGIALADRLSGVERRVFVLLGDGEIQEGSVWESAMTAAHYGLDRVCAILDRNGIQENGPTSDIKKLDPILEKFESFGWYVMEMDGHDFMEMKQTLDKVETVNGRPVFIKARTVKGKGVSFMEGRFQWHGKAPNRQELEEALKELGS